MGKKSKAKNELLVTLEDFGGRVDDKNFDNRLPLKRAIDFLSNNGGGIVRPGKRGTIYFNGSIDKPSGPDHVTIEGFSFFNVDTTDYPSEYAKRDAKIRVLLEELLVDLFITYRPDNVSLSVEGIEEHTKHFQDYLDRIDELGL